MSTVDVAQRRVTIEDVERKAVAVHLQAESYRQKLANVLFLCEYSSGCAQKLFDSIVRKDSSLQGISLEEYVKSPHVGPVIYSHYRVFCEASSQAEGLKDMIRTREIQRDEALIEWKHFHSFAPKDYVSSVEGFEALMRST